MRSSGAPSLRCPWCPFSRCASQHRYRLDAILLPLVHDLYLLTVNALRRLLGNPARRAREFAGRFLSPAWRKVRKLDAVPQPGAALRHNRPSSRPGALSRLTGRRELKPWKPAIWLVAHCRAALWPPEPNRWLVDFSSSAGAHSSYGRTLLSMR